MNGLRIEDIVLRSGASLILDHVSLDLTKTGSVAIIGPNGAGKSSLLRIAAGVAAPSEGRVTLGGVEISRMGGTERAKAIGYVPQHFVPHWDLTADDLVQLGLERAGRASRDAVAMTISRFEIDRFAKQRWSTLSGGERARILMAMILGTDPPVMLADEPGASLDIRHRMSLVKTLAKRSGDQLSLVVMHDLDLAFRFFDRIILMAGGRIVADAPPNQMFESPVLDETFGVPFKRVMVDRSMVLLPA